MIKIDSYFRDVTYPTILPGLYMVNDQGIIVNKITGKVLRYGIDKDGYYKVSVSRKHGNKAGVFVHRIVA